MMIQKLEYLEIKDKVSVRTPTDCLSLLNEFYKLNEISKTQEVFCLISLDGNHNVIAIDFISIGTVNKTIVHIRDIYKTLFIHNAASFIVCHNHPSGNVYPSEDDELTTNTLYKSSLLMGIQMLDHLIVSTNDYENSYFSFVEHDLFSEIQNEIKDNSEFIKLMEKI